MNEDAYLKKRSINLFRLIAVNVSWWWLFIFALIPFILIFFTSFLTAGTIHLVQLPFTLANYHNILDILYLKIFIRSLLLASICTLFTLILGYPFAYIIAQSPNYIKNIFLLLLMIPFWTSSLIRSYAMMALLKTKGLINNLLIFLGIIHAPMQLLFTNFAVVIGLVYNLLPFMILPLYANIERLDLRLIDAARDLGANRVRIFRSVIVPLTLPGIVAGCVIVFLPAMTLFYIPDILGGSKSMLLGNLIQDQFLFANNWPLGATISVILTLFMGILFWFYWRTSSPEQRTNVV